jgi:hypothetical protein
MSQTIERQPPLPERHAARDAAAAPLAPARPSTVHHGLPAPRAAATLAPVMSAKASP